MKSKLIITSLLATALMAPAQASAQCTIVSSRLQQVSEREILAIIDGKCTKENGESGYYTQIAPDTYGEVMAVFGHRNLDQYGIGFYENSGYNIVFQNTQDSYSAGVWIGDSDGVVHSEVMTIANQFATNTTTTSTTTIPLSPSTTAPKAAQVVPAQATVQETAPSPQIAEVVPTTTVPETTTTTTTVLVSIQKQVTPKKAAPKCSSRQKSCKLRAVGATKTTGRK
jgi:hypothetical protein